MALKIARFSITLLLLLTFADSICQEQDTTQLYQIETRDGNHYAGRIIKRFPDAIQFRTTNLGLLTLQIKDIASIDLLKASEVRSGVLWFENPQATRYLWMPNGFGLKAGEGYYQNIWVLFNHVSVGITDRFSVGAGVIPLFLFGGAPTPAWFTPKVSIPVEEDKVHLGAGGFFGGVLGIPKSSFGVLYGLVTIGNRDQNLSLGAGLGYAGGEFATNPAMSLSGMVRLSPKAYLLTENYYITAAEGASHALLTFGGRIIMKNVGLDFGVILPAFFDDPLIAIPWLGITAPFGRKLPSGKRGRL